MAGKLFKKAFVGGYNRKSVEAEIAALQAEVEAGKTRIAELTEKSEQQAAQLARFEQERTLISDALLTAQREGEKLLSQARAEIEELQTAAQAELDRLYALAEEERERIRGYQKSAYEMLKEHKEHADSIEI